MKAAAKPKKTAESGKPDPPFFWNAAILVAAEGYDWISIDFTT